MRPLSWIGFVLVAFGVTGCAETKVADVRVHGLFGVPPAEEIRAIIANNPAHEKVYEIQVISSSEMHVYTRSISESFGYAIVRRINGKWTYIEKIMIGS